MSKTLEEIGLDSVRSRLRWISDNLQTEFDVLKEFGRENCVKACCEDGEKTILALEASIALLSRSFPKESK